MYLLLPTDAPIPDWIRIDLTLSSARVQVQAFGEVLRVERLPNGTGVALRLHHLELKRRQNHDA